MNQNIKYYFNLNKIFLLKKNIFKKIRKKVEEMDAASEQIPAGSMRSNIRALRTPGKEGAAKESSGGWATCSGRKH